MTTTCTARVAMVGEGADADGGEGHREQRPAGSSGRTSAKPIVVSVMNVM